MTTEVLLVIAAVFALALLGLIIAIVWIAVAVVWPYVKKQYELTREYRQREQDQFIAMLRDQVRSSDAKRQLDVQMIEASSLQTNAIRGQTTVIQRLVDSLTPKRKAVPKPPKDTEE